MTDTRQVQAAVDRLASALDLPVLIEDLRFQPLWWSAQGTVDGTRMRTILQRAVEPIAAAMVVTWGLAKADGPVRTPAAPEAEMLARWCVPLRQEGHLYGYLWVVDGDDVVTENQLADIVACSERATAHLARLRTDEDEHHRRRHHLLDRLQHGPNTALTQELMALENLATGTTVVVHAPAAPGGWQLRGAMSAHINPPTGHVATSGVPVALDDLHLAVRRAQVVGQVLRAGARLSQRSWAALGSWHLIAAAPEDLAVSDLHPGAEVLLGLPRQELAETARTVLDHGGDVARAAGELHIHRTTLYYRLDRIEALTGVNVRDGQARDDLHNALRLAAYRKAAESDPG